MTLLISNDDGIHAPGIICLAAHLDTLGETFVVAPDRNCSGASSSLTLEEPLRIYRHSDKRIAVKGTPTDCVHLAINELVSAPPELVIAGINAGANLGDDVLYSGTVAAAMEGRNLGLPAIAISLVGSKGQHYETAARVAAELVQRLRNQTLPSNQILNVNVPDVPYDSLKGYQVTRLGCRHRAEKMIREHDPRGHEIFWLGPPGEQQDAGQGTDFYAVSHGYVSITPLTIDMTAYSQMNNLEQWLMEGGS